ncbi:hypothetical protein [Sphingomonas arenae]|nr:hypothetical protein [Sphingomonas arenae]
MIQPAGEQIAQPLWREQLRLQCIEHDVVELGAADPPPLAYAETGPGAV